LVNIDKIKEEWNNRGFSCGLWVDELILLVEGQVELDEMKGEEDPIAGKTGKIDSGRYPTFGSRKGPTASKWLYGYENP